MKVSILGEAISVLIEKYQFAVDQPWIQKPMSYALYHTWKEFDRIEPAKIESEVLLHRE